MIASFGSAACNSHAVVITHLAFIDCCAPGLFFGLGIFCAFGFGLTAHAAWFASGITVRVPWADSALFLGLLACEAGG